MLVAAVLWAGVYDTMYAMVDRDDDLRIGVQSSAILFADMDRFMIAAMQLMVLFALLLIGRTLQFGGGYNAGLVAGACCFLWQQWLIRHREPRRLLHGVSEQQLLRLRGFRRHTAAIQCALTKPAVPRRAAAASVRQHRAPPD